MLRSLCSVLGRSEDLMDGALMNLRWPPWAWEDDHPGDGSGTAGHLYISAGWTRGDIRSSHMEIHIAQPDPLS